MSRPNLIVCSGPDLFASFFPPAYQRKLTRLCTWQRDGTRTVTAAFKRKLATADALITTWDSPHFSDDLLQIAHRLLLIAHCGGEVKSRFARSLFDRLTICNAPAPMARATAEMGAALLLYCARNLDSYRDRLRARSNRIYREVHLRGVPESLAGSEVAMIGCGRIGRALMDLLRGFDLHWLVYDPHASRSLANDYPIQFVRLETLLHRAHLLILTAALTEETRGLLNRDRLSHLPDGATVINIGRGGLLDLAALTREVQRKRLRCALDVTDPQEPLPVGHPLRTLPGSIVTPHVAGSGRRVREQIAEVVLADLEGFFRRGRVNNRVTTAMLDRMT
jgi:phosphoglycerate dehydrogenase-like enzyme